MGADDSAAASSRAVALIGDVIASKQVTDRAALQGRLVAAFAAINAAVPAIQPLAATLGDEFQAVYTTTAAAIRATVLVRLHLLPTDTRYGLGVGELTVFSPPTPASAVISQDGTAWWAAREAIEYVQAQQGRRGHARSLRTWLVDPTPSATTAALNAFLVSRDETIGLQSDRARRLLRGALLGHTQQQLADAEQISQSAVSQQLGTSGSYALRDAQELLDASARSPASPTGTVDGARR